MFRCGVLIGLFVLIISAVRPESLCEHDFHSGCVLLCYAFCPFVFSLRRVRCPPPCCPPGRRSTRAWPAPACPSADRVSHWTYSVLFAKSTSKGLTSYWINIGIFSFLEVNSYFECVFISKIYRFLFRFKVIKFSPKCFSLNIAGLKR